MTRARICRSDRSPRIVSSRLDFNRLILWIPVPISRLSQRLPTSSEAVSRNPVQDNRLLLAEPFWVSKGEEGPPTILKNGSYASLMHFPVAMSRNKQNTSRGEAVWIYHPWLDLVVGCGAWSVPLLLLAYFSSVASTLTWSALFYGLALFFNYPHYMATIYRAYHTKEDFERYRIFTVHITLLVVLTVIFSHFWIRSLPWIFTLYLTASPWHYSGQNYGLFMMFARRAGAQPTNLERRALYAAFLISYAVLLLSLHTGPSGDPLFVSLNIPEAISSRAQVVLAIVFVACSAFGLSRLIAQARFRRMIPSLTLFSTQCVWFLVPSLLSLLEGFQVPRSRYSTGVLAVMHSAQYLWITSYYSKREAATTPRPALASIFLFRDSHGRGCCTLYPRPLALKPGFPF